LITAFCSVTIGLMVLIGWALRIEILKRVAPGFVAMNPATALCFILSGAALGLAHFRCRRGAAIAAAAIVAIALAKIADFAGAQINLDQILFKHFLDVASESFPNRMAPNTAAAFLFAGVAIALGTSRKRTLQLLSQALGICVILIGLFTVAGHAFSIQHLRSVGSSIPMALHTGVAFIVLAAGIVSLNRHVGVMLVLRDTGPAGALSRIVLPLATLIPIAMGTAHLWAQQQDFYDPQEEVAVMVIANVVVTCVLLLTVVRALYRSDSLRKDREEALRQSEIFNRTINESSPDAVSLLDSEGNVLFSNEAAVQAYGLEDALPLLGRPWGHRLSGESRQSRDVALAAARDGRVGAVTYPVTSLTGELRWFESLVSRLEGGEGQSNQFIVMSRDITQQKRVEEQVRWTATHDSLTRLPNRALFQERLDRLTNHKRGTNFAVLLLDIDDFKQVNDTLGHDAGDALLCTVAGRLRASVRPEDFVARLAGDEFAIILERARSEADAAAAAEKIFRSMREPWFHDGRVGDCRVSIGASIAPDHGKEASKLLKNADIALYVAKVHHPGQLAVFQPEMRAEMQRRSSQIALARHALKEDLVAPFYQPKVELESGKLIGFEALLRWHHPTDGTQLPASIGAAFEDLELAREITGRILGRALMDVRDWLDAGVEFGHVAFNVAAADFKQRDFAERLLEQVDSNSIPRHRLQVEVTETVFLGRGAEYVEHALKILSAGGIRIALDDFGTGYASLSHLKQFPVDIVKIDRSFLRNVLQDTHNSAIIKTVVSLGRSLDLDVVAEGVETTEQEAYLIEQGCRYGQGYLYGKAAPASGIPNLIRSWAGKTATLPEFPRRHVAASRR